MKLFSKRKKMTFDNGFIHFQIGPSQKVTDVKVIIDSNNIFTVFIDNEKLDFNEQYERHNIQ